MKPLLMRKVAFRAGVKTLKFEISLAKFERNNTGWECQDNSLIKMETLAFLFGLDYIAPL